MIKNIMLAAVIAAMPLSVTAAEFPDPKGDVILTISGEIGGGDPIDFDMEMIEAMPSKVIETSTPWTDGIIKLEGVPLSELMNAVEANGDTLAAVALNDYVSELPMTDLEKYGPIIAYKMNDKYMEVSDKGPFFIVYPFDSNPELQSQMYYQRSVWQIRELVVE